MHLWADIGEGLRWLWHHPVLRFVAFLADHLFKSPKQYITIALQGDYSSPRPDSYLDLR